MSRSRPPKCVRGRGCGVCGTPNRVERDAILERIEQRDMIVPVNRERDAVSGEFDEVDPNAETKPDGRIDLVLDS